MSRIAVVVAVLLGALAAGGGALWWRLGAGPVAIDFATPWLKAALEERLGQGHSVDVGGTVLERNEDGRTALRLHDVVVRNAGGGVVASAPKAELGLSSSGLLLGQIKAERLSLIGAAMALRIDRSGQVAVFAAAEKPRAAGAVPDERGAPAPAEAPVAAATARDTPGMLNAALSWLSSLDSSGLDGGHMVEVGLQSGSLVVDDERSGRRLNFDNIHFGIRRLEQGGAAVAVTSSGADGPWSLNAAVTRLGNGNRAIEAVMRDVSPRDILLAMRMSDPDFDADVPLSGVLQAEIDANGSVRMLRCRLLAGAGHVGMAADPATRMLIDEVQVELVWDPGSRVLRIPVEINSGPNRFTMVGLVRAPVEEGAAWHAAIPQGTVRLASLDRPNEQPIVLDRVSLQANFDPAASRLNLEKLDIRGLDGGVALSGVLDATGVEPRLIIGAAGSPMQAPAFRRIWPVFVVPELRKWVHENLYDGKLERLIIGTNMPMSAMRPKAPPLPKEGLSVDIEGSDVTFRAVVGLPPIRGARITGQANGRMARVKIEGGIVDLPSGRRLGVSEGVFNIADLGQLPLQAQTTFRVEGPVDAVVELLGMEPLRGSTDLPPELASATGQVSAVVTVAFPLVDGLTDRDFRFRVEAEVASFAADKLLRGQRTEAAKLKVAATEKMVEIGGDMRIAGAPANVSFRRAAGEAEADIVLETTLDAPSRARLGLDFGGALGGPTPVKLSGRMAANNVAGGGRFAVEVDLTQATVDELMPGWTKPAGRSSRLNFTLIDRGRSMRLENFVLEGSGGNARGTIELDGQGELVSANLPVFAMSDGDKASLKAERASDGAMKISLRGDVYDGRGLVKGTVSGQRSDQRSQRAPDLDIDMRLGAMPGFHGEALRSVELRLSRRSGQIRVFVLSGRLGNNATLRGDLRMRGAGRQVLYLESTDAGALFRFTDIYARVFGGSMSMAMDPPVLDGAPREGLLNIRDFVVRGEPGLEGVASSTANPGEVTHGRQVHGGSGVAFSRLRAEFTRSPGRFAIREGVVWGPTIGATVEGALDYDRDQVRLRGTFVPAYSLNNMFSRLPVLGLFLGGGANEGLLGVTYQVVGTPRAPTLQVNPISAVAPGFLRKLFEFRADGATGQVPDPAYR